MKCQHWALLPIHVVWCRTWVSVWNANALHLLFVMVVRTSMVCSSFLPSAPVPLHSAHYNDASGTTRDLISWASLDWLINWLFRYRIKKTFWRSSRPQDGTIIYVYVSLYKYILYTYIYIYIYKIGILRGYAIRSGRRPEGSQRPQGGPQVRPGRWLPEGRLPDRIA